MRLEFEFYQSYLNNSYSFSASQKVTKRCSKRTYDLDEFHEGLPNVQFGIKPMKLSVMKNRLRPNRLWAAGDV